MCTGNTSKGCSFTVTFQIVPAEEIIATFLIFVVVASMSEEVRCETSRILGDGAFRMQIIEIGNDCIYEF